MSSLESLPPDQRAVLELVLRRGRSYDEIAQLLSIDRAGVRQRALSALDALGPDAGVAPERRALITDYLLGALPPRVTEQVRDRLATSPAERAWARVIAAELESVAANPLPEIPAGPESPAAAPETGLTPEEELASLAATGAVAPAEPEAPARPERQRTRDQPAVTPEKRRWRRRERAPSRPRPEPAVEPGEPRPVSRRGGRVVLTAAGIIVLAVVLSVIFSNGGSNNPSSHASRTGTTLTQSSGTTTTSTTPAGSKLLAQLNLNPPSGGKAKGIAEVLREGGKDGLAIVATGLTPNTAHDAYAVWLSNAPNDSHLLGFVSPGVGANGRLQTAGALPANASHYHKLLVTLETKATPKSPGTVVLEAALTGV